jgi:CheY-like chemotaxis protein
MLQKWLQENGYAGIEAGDAPSGLRALEAEPRIDLLITDLGRCTGPERACSRLPARLG